MKKLPSVVLAIFVLAACLFAACEQPAGSDPEGAARAAAEAFARTHATALNKTAASVTIADEARVDAALAAYDALSRDAQALLTAEKTLLDSLKTRIVALAAAQEAAEAYKTAHATALAKTTASVMTDDEAGVDAALAAYTALDPDAQALLDAEKTLLDSLKAKIDQLKGDGPAQTAANAFKTDHAAVLAKATTALAATDGAAVNAALAAYEALDPDAQALLTAEKALLDSHKTRIDALAAAQEAAEAYKTAHAAVLAKATADLSADDEAAVNAALAAHKALDPDTQALLAVEKALLDSHKTRIDALNAAAAYKTSHAPILARTTATVTVADEAAVDAALAAHRGLSADAQALLAVEKALLDSLKARINTLKANAYTAAHAAILAKTTENVAVDDEAAVDAALTAYNALDTGAKALLGPEKALLDSLKTRIEQLQGAGPGRSIILWDALDMAMIGVDGMYALDSQYVLMANIELENWTPIGSAAEPFSGIFDGNGYKITIKSFDESLFNDGEAQEPGVGLGVFGWTRGSPEAPAYIKDLDVRAELDHLVSETDACYVGALVGYADEYTELSNISVEGSLVFTNKNMDEPQRPVFVGGIAGALIASELKDSDVSADIQGAGMAGNGLYNYVGGAVGMFDRNQADRSLNPTPIPGVPFAGASIVNCRVTGNVHGWTEGNTANVMVGGIAGGAFYGMKTYYGGKIEDCSSTGNVRASGGGYWSWAGGIAGTISGDGHDDPDTEAAGPSATGPTRIVRSYATGSIVAEGPQGSWPYAGGIVGNNYYGGLVSQCWFDGTVKAEGDRISDYTGGIAGYNSKQYYGHGSRIEDCWSAGQVEGHINAGGIVGQNQVAAITERCYSTALISVRAAKGATASLAQQGVGGIAGYNAVADGRAGGTVQNCVALNPSITADGGFELLYRVVGNGEGSHSNNLARQDMEIIISGSPSAADDTGANAKGGGDCAAQPAQSVYQGLGWDFTSVWKMDGSYPVLRWQ
jgi:hypothetical protein